MEMQIKSDRWLEEFKKFPVLDIFFKNLVSRSEHTEILNREDGIEVHFLNEVKELQNRARLRIHFPVDGKCVLFFYKKSSIPFSRDRFSYGGIVVDARSTGRFHEDDVNEWIEFLISGLQPAHRPKSLKKSIPYTIPEDE
jgi:hypothetical protein